jgi:phage gp46-like protein
MSTHSLFIDATTRDFDLQNGNLVYANALLTMAYTRIVIPLGSWGLDPTFGSNLPNWINTRKFVTAQIVINEIQRTEQDLINNGYASSVKTTVLDINNPIGFLLFRVEVTDTNNASYPINVSLIRRPGDF